MTTDVDILEVLEQDHRRISDLAERLDSVTDDDEVRDLYRQIVDGLLAHEAIERRILFPAFHSLHDAAGDEQLDSRLAEHEELNSLLTEMRDLDVHDHAFVKRCSALVNEIERHFELEESTVFVPLRRGLSEHELVELGRRAMAAGPNDAD